MNTVCWGDVCGLISCVRDGSELAREEGRCHVIVFQVEIEMDGGMASNNGLREELLVDYVGKD